MSGYGSSTALPGGAMTSDLVSDTVAITTVTVGTASTTLSALLVAAGGAMDEDVRRVTLGPLGNVSVAIGAAAVSGTNTLSGGAGVFYQFACKSTTDMRLIASTATNVSVWQEA